MNDKLPVGRLTIDEIAQQPELWPTTLQRVEDFSRDHSIEAPSAAVTGAGTSAYAAFAVAASCPDCVSIPSTDLLISDLACLRRVELLISLARSGDSPESLAVVQRVRHKLPDVRHMAITCNAEGKLATADHVEALVLDPRTNDRSLVMTSSFSNIVLAGVALRHQAVLSQELPAICNRVTNSLVTLRDLAFTVAARLPSRIVFLGSGSLFGAAREGALKILEMTAGHVATQAETYLGLRHGPMSFLRRDTVVVCFLSSDPVKRRYEGDLIEELQGKQLGWLVGIGDDEASPSRLHVRVPAMAPGLPDELRTPFEIVFAQLLGVELSLRAGLDPDNPSPGGVIQRVVPGFRIHADE